MGQSSKGMKIELILFESGEDLLFSTEINHITISVVRSRKMSMFNYLNTRLKS